MRACPTTSPLVRTLRQDPSASPASHAAPHGLCDVVAVGDVQEPGQRVIVVVDALGVHPQDAEQVCSRLALNLNLHRCWTGGELHREIRSMRNSCCPAMVAVAHGPLPEHVPRDLAVASPGAPAQLEPRAHPRSGRRVRPVARADRPHRPARRIPTRAAPAAVATNSDPSPCLMRTVRTSPAAARRRAWSYVTARPHPHCKGRRLKRC